MSWRSALVGAVLLGGAVIVGYVLFPFVGSRPGLSLLALIAMAGLISTVIALLALLRFRRVRPSPRWLPVVAVPVLIWAGAGIGLAGATILAEEDTAPPMEEDVLPTSAATQIYDLEVESFALPEALIAATQSVRGTLTQVEPLGEDRFLVVLSPGTLIHYDVDTAAPAQGFTPEAMEAMEAVVAVVDIGGAELEVIEQATLPGVRRVRGIELSEDRGELYVTDVAVEPGCVALDVHRFTLALEPLEASDPERIFRSEPCLEEGELALHQAGGRLATTAEGHLLVTVGDFDIGGSYQGEMQEGRPEQLEPPAQYGTVIELDPSAGTSELLVSGLRNAQGITVDPATDQIWVTDHGPAGGDELNLIVDGADYGWPDVSYGIPYGPGLPEGVFDTDSFGARHEGYERPRWVWAPAIAPSQLLVYHGTELAMPAWEGDLLIGSLRDTSLRRVRFDDDRIIIDERIPLGRRLRDVITDDRGHVVMSTDSAEIIRLSVRGSD
jgi:hypothetical protein